MGEQQHSNNHNQNNYTQQKTLRDLFLPKTTLSTTKQSKWAAAATPTALARAALALRAPAPATNRHHPLPIRSFGNIPRQHHNVTASPRRSSSSSFLKRENM